MVLLFLAGIDVGLTLDNGLHLGSSSLFLSLNLIRGGLSLVELELQALLAKFIFDRNPFAGVAAHDFKKLLLLVVREATLRPQVRLHVGE